VSNLREDSKKTWTSNGSIDHINAGSLQRIADAMELMARGYQELIRERDQYKHWYEHRRDRHEKAERRIIALKGVITRMRKVKA
jgi:hypothetical protein